MKPDEQGVFFQLVIQGGGTFTYDAAGNLRSAEVGQTITDPIQGITCYAGISTFNGHGAVISLFSSTLDAQLWYIDTGSSTQGALRDSVASAAGTDPFGTAFKVGVNDYHAGIGFAALVAGGLAVGTLNAGSLVTNSASVGFGDVTVASGQPYANLASPVTSAAAGAQIVLLGESQDASKPAQALIAPSSSVTPSTTALLEVQGAMATTSLNSITASGDLLTSVGNVKVLFAGQGLQVKEGSNAKQGRATLVGGTVTIANTSVTATSIIVVGTVTPSANPGAPFVSAKTAGTGFTVKSTSATDTGVIGYQIFEAP